MYLLYRLLTALGMLFIAPYYAWRGWRRREPARTLGERFGFLAPDLLSRASVSPGAIWIHAVSVGEVLAAQPLVERLKKHFPDRAIFVSTTTETGQRLARERLRCAEAIFYFPLDWAVPVRRSLRAIYPSLVIVMETEIWPNFLREARRRDIPVVFVNARISEKSFARFQQWKFLVGEFYERVLRDPSLFLAQTDSDAARLREMGASEERVEVIGNLKYDSDPPTIGPFGAWLAKQIQQQERWPVVVAGSVVAEEEQAVMAAYDIVQRQWRRALLILAPRKPDRFDAAAEIASTGGWTAIRRSKVDLQFPLDENADVLVLNSIGELAGLYSLADAVFVGGSLVPSGGHNILEPAWFAKPPVFGTSMENFQDMSQQFLSARAAVQVASGPQLGKVWVQMIQDKPLADRMGKAARALCERNRGATGRALDRITVLLAGADRYV
ncbi:MAG TPA: 3-deoxy-D-manno-octulosonic acid transferase [Candidatus Acidoferrales bacterium]|jgi:3-deoxy-D-manno-octulosonic-acid transferase|nr:3-deoxy-D-manno-octulosonic acid transferase [Candidatus Acidoferrales bacterium]